MIERSAAELTVSVAVFEVAPVPPLVEVIALVVLLNVPAVVGATSNEMVQVLSTASVPPLKVSVVSPAEGTKVGEPQPADTEILGGLATCKPAGNASLKPTPVSATVLPAGAVTIKLSVLVPPRYVEIGEKDLLMSGGDMTVNVAEAVLPVPPFVEETAPLVLFKSPFFEPITLTLTVQLPFGAIEPPFSVIELLVLETVPPHWAESGAVATVIPEGKVSVNLTPVSVTAFDGGLVIVKVSVETAPAGIVSGEKALPITGAITA